MAYHFLTKIKKRLHENPIKFNRRFFVFVFFLIISTALWFLNALSKEYTTIIQYPIEYINLPPNKTFLERPTQKLILKVSGLGFALLQYDVYKSQQPITFNIMEIAKEETGKENIPELVIHT